MRMVNQLIPYAPMAASDMRNSDCVLSFCKFEFPFLGDPGADAFDSARKGPSSFALYYVQ